MEPIIITEREKNILSDVILTVIIFFVPICFLIWALIDLNGSGFVIFFICVLLIIPGFIVAGYIWDVKAKIILSKEGVVISYGRSIYDIVNFEARFRIPPDSIIPWEQLAGFKIESVSHVSSDGSDGTSSVKTNHYLFIHLVDRDKSTGDYSCVIRLRRFDKTPRETLALCEQFQREYGKPAD